MNYFTVRDLRSKPGKVWETIAESKEAVITNNGKPCVLMIGLEGRDPEEVLASVRQAMVMKAVNQIRLDSARQGLDHMTDEEIDGEIASARKERRQK